MKVFPRALGENSVEIYSHDRSESIFNGKGVLSERFRIHHSLNCAQIHQDHGVFAQVIANESQPDSFVDHFGKIPQNHFPPHLLDALPDIRPKSADIVAKLAADVAHEVADVLPHTVQLRDKIVG
jgi:hypothetical protein